MKETRKIVLLLAILLALVMTACNYKQMVWNSLDVRDGTKFVVMSVRPAVGSYGYAYQYNLNLVSKKRLLIDGIADYGYIDSAKYNVGDTLVLKIMKQD